MCKYCKDFVEDEGPVRVIDIPLTFGKAKVGYSELWIEGYSGNEMQLCLAMCNEQGDYAYEKHKTIKYCPFCGQEYKKLFEIKGE